ncbi:hypothetical protein B0J11DRAFT_526087 [Dendryphion nanum]|uniref:Uncharacterized protein n=1 Tax=Dendryphion nanum TaxID=256645 RepID=A0A9P9DX74_9PLEO|nr:hypothetical protein B0J11DRAFT_526087 [Dendryphion nanum]
MLPNFLLWAGYAANWGLLLQVTVVSPVSADCYSHDGVLARDSKIYVGPELVSCGNNTNTCCLSDEKCGTNLLCANTAGTSTRQYCADKDWKKCSQICAETFPRAGTLLTDCGRNIFCCGTGATACCRDGKGFFIDPANGDMTPASLANNGTLAQPTYWKVDTSAVLAAATAASLSSSTFSSSATTTRSATTASSTGPTSTSTSTTTSTPSGGGGLSAGAGAGIGIGCAALVGGIIALAWFLIRKRRKQKTQSQAPVAQYQDNNGYPPNYNNGHTPNAGNGFGADNYGAYTYKSQGVPGAPAPPPMQELEGTSARHEMR